MESNNYPGSYYQPLFDLLNQEHGITPLESEMTDIIEVVEKMRGKQPGPRWVKAIDRNPPVNTRLHLKIKGVNHVGFWDAPANCYVTFLDNAYPITDVEWLDEQPSADSKPEPKWVKGALQWAKETIDFAWDYVKVSESLVETWGNMYMNTMHAIQQAQQEIEQPAAGREEDAVAFAEWILKNDLEATFNDKGKAWVDFRLPLGKNKFTTAELFELFKQHNP